MLFKLVVDKKNFTNIKYFIVLFKTFELSKINSRYFVFTFVYTNTVSVLPARSHRSHIPTFGQLRTVLKIGFQKTCED